MKPLVPDLSITEEPGAEEPFFPNRCQQSVTAQESQSTSVLIRQKPLLEECKTYSEWRKKSAVNAKPRSIPAKHNHEHSYIHHINGTASPTVLDNLSSKLEVPTFDSCSASSSGRRQRQSETIGKDCQVNGTSLNLSHSAPRITSQKSWDAAPVHLKSSRRKTGSEDLSPRQECNSKVPSRKSHSRHSTDSHLSHNLHHFVGHHPEAPTCMGCAHWPHQQMTAVNYNGIPLCHPYPHMGMPPCNGMPPKPSSALPVPSPKSRSISGHSGRISGNSFNESVVYDNLYQIVLSQSEQLKTLQAQVEKLLVSQENHRCKGIVESERGNRRSIPVVERGTQTSDGESNVEDGAKMSIGVMTSFIHTVAYTERLGLLDSRNKGVNRNIAVDPRSKMHNGHSHSASTSPPSQAPPSSSSSSQSEAQVSPQSGVQMSCGKCCECMDNTRKNQRRSQMKTNQHDQMEEDFGLVFWAFNMISACIHLINFIFF